MMDGCCNLKNMLNPTKVNQLVQTWLEEDVPNFDYGGLIVGDKKETAVLLCKKSGLLSGCPFFENVFEQLGCHVDWLKSEGDELEPNTIVAKVSGSANKLLLGERTALNCLARASGVATYCSKLKHIAIHNKWQGSIAGTRKTTPGFRLVEKYSMIVGGIDTHRYNLSSMIMLKDNHMWISGNASKAVHAAKAAGGFSVKIEVECRSIDEAKEAALAGADIIMLDNFSPQAIHKAAQILKGEFPHLLIEASGGITEENISEYMGENIDIISSSKCSQGYSVIDFSLKILRDGHDPNNPTVNDVSN